MFTYPHLIDPYITLESIDWMMMMMMMLALVSSSGDKSIPALPTIIPLSLSIPSQYSLYLYFRQAEKQREQQQQQQQQQLRPSGTEEIFSVKLRTIPWCFLSLNALPCSLPTLFPPNRNGDP